MIWAMDTMTGIMATSLSSASGSRSPKWIWFLLILYSLGADRMVFLP